MEKSYYQKAYTVGEECDMDIEIVNSVWASSWEEAQEVELDMRILKDTMFAFVKKKARCRKSGWKKRVANVYYERQEADIQTLEERAKSSTI